METRTMVLPVPTRVLMSAVCMALAMSALFLLLPSQVHAADRYFIGRTSSSWDDTANWSATKGGAGGQTVPGLDDVAIFAGGAGNMNLMTSAAKVVDGLVLAHNFTGSVNIGTGFLMVRETGIEVGSGRLIASGNGQINSSGAFVQTGGTVRIRVLSLSGSFTAKLGAAGVPLGFSASGYLFSSTGVVTFNRLDGDQAVVIGASGASFSGITVNLRGGTTIDDVTVNASGALTLSGNLVITRGNLDFNVYNENLIVDEGDITLADTDSSGAANAQLTTDQNVTHSGGNLTVNYDAIFTMTGGTWTYQGGRTGDITYQLNGPDKRFFNFTLNDTAAGSNDSVILAGSGLNLSGALTITQGNLDLTTNSKAMIVERGVTVANSAEAQLTSNSAMTISGSVTVNASSVLTVTAGTTTFIDDGDMEVGLDDQALYNVTLNMIPTLAGSDNLVVRTGAFSASGTLTLTRGELDMGGRQLTVSGSISVADAGTAAITATGRVFLGGSITHGTAGGLMLTGATVTLNGGADQSIQILSVGSRFGALTINNRGGSLADDIIWSGAPLTVSGALTITLGNLDVGSNNIVLRADGGLTMASNAQATLTTDSNMAMSGTIDVGASAVLVVTGGTLTLNDDGPQSVDFDDQIVNIVTLNVLTTGTENGAVHVEYGSSFISSGSLTITKGDLKMFGKTLTVSGSITVADDGQATIVATGTVNIGGNVTQNFAGGLMMTGATLTLNGQADQTIAVKSPGPGRLGGGLTINNIGSSFGAATFDDVLWTGATLTVSGALTITKGNLDLNVYNIVLLADGGISLTSDSEARLTTDQNVSVSGSFVVGASSVMLLSGGTVTFNDDGNMEVDLDDQELQNVTLNLIPVVTGEDNLVVRDDTFTASGKLTVTRGELDMGGQALNISGSILIANSGTAVITATGSVTFGSGMDIGAAGGVMLTGANLTLNGIDQQLQFGRTITEDETISINGGYLRNLTINASSGVTLASGQVRAFNTLTIATGSVLALGANTLGNTGGTIFNYALLREDTGKVVNTGTLLNIADSNYADVSEVKTAQTVYITFREDDENIDGTVADTLSVTITTAAGESEALTLTETTKTSRIFRSSLPTEKATVVKNDGKIQTTADTTLTVSFTDAQDALVNTDTVAFTIVGGAVAAGGGGGGRGSGGGGSGGGGGGTSVSLVEKLVDAQQKAKKEDARQERLDERIEEGNLGTRGVLEATVDGKKVSFSDVPVKQWFAEFVLRVIDSGIASGYKDARGRLTGTFGPANNVTYAEIAKMALEAAGKDADDVAGKPKNRNARGGWSEKYIKLAEDLELSVYHSTLNVNTPADRGAVVQTIMEAAGFDIEDVPAGYKDLRGNHPNANAIGSATALGIVSGDTDREGNPIGRFRPNDPINRAEVSKIMSKVLELLGR